MPATVLIAPDAFKGTATAVDVAEALARGWRSLKPDDDITLLPLADGGEGTMACFAEAVPGSRRIPADIQDRDGKMTQAEWLALPDGTGLVELAATCPMRINDPDPLGAHTYLFGQLIAAALDSGVQKLLLALGGSASTDGGTGALTALGARFLTTGGRPVDAGGGGLRDLVEVDLSDLRAAPAGGIEVLGDVTNPLLGPEGAAHTFGPQKGADLAQVRELEAGLSRLAALMPEIRPTAPGAGAAGGTGFGLMAWGARIRSGASVVLERTRFAERLADSCLVITGEGRYDVQTAAGKLIDHVVRRCGDAGVAVGLVAGSVEADTSRFGAVIELSSLAGGEAAAKSDPLFWAERAGRSLARLGIDTVTTEK